MFWFLLSICMFELLTFFALLRTMGTTYDILLKEKNQTNAKLEIIPYVRLRGAAQEYFFCSYQSLTFLEKIHSVKEKF